MENFPLVSSNAAICTNLCEARKLSFKDQFLSLAHVDK